jgi:hypothetical protein
VTTSSFLLSRRLQAESRPKMRLNLNVGRMTERKSKSCRQSDRIKENHVCLTHFRTDQRRAKGLRGCRNVKPNNFECNSTSAEPNDECVPNASFVHLLQLEPMAFKAPIASRLKQSKSYCFALRSRVSNHLPSAFQHVTGRFDRFDKTCRFRLLPECRS